MSNTKWYPAAISALVLGCGGATEDGHGANTGGSSKIDSGVPTSTGGNPVAYYGVPFTTVGGTTTFDVASGGSGASAATIVDVGTGGLVTIYGPRFDRPKQSNVSSGGSQSCIPANAEGGALQNSPRSTCESKERK